MFFFFYDYLCLCTRKVVLTGVEKMFRSSSVSDGKLDLVGDFKRSKLDKSQLFKNGHVHRRFCFFGVTQKRMTVPTHLCYRHFHQMSI